MQAQLIELSHEPPVVFVALFFLSLVASYILFKLLDSRATIRRKGWSAGGAIAGFLLILFGSWYAVKPSFSGQQRILPVSTPAGFKIISASDAGVAIAIPSDWERKDMPTTLRFEPKAQEPNSSDPKMMVIQIQACEDLRLLTSEEDLAQTKQSMKEL